MSKRLTELLERLPRLSASEYEEVRGLVLKMKEALELSRRLFRHPDLCAAEDLARMHGHVYGDEFCILTARRLQLIQAVLDD